MQTQPVGRFCRAIRLCCTLLLFLMTAIPILSRAQVQQQAKTTGSAPIPKPAIPAILTAFDTYEVIALPEAHGMKDMDDFILALIRDPEFPRKVNDIAVECGNSLYQGELDRYIAGENVPFTEARKVWRNTTQPACGMSGFFEQFFPLMRAINLQLPPENRLRVLACDSPIDWDQVKSFQDGFGFFAHRDENIASVMEKEVLSKHRKALMLFGTFHLMHTPGAKNAVSIYEKEYPNRTFVISDFGVVHAPPISSKAFVSWPVPSLVLAKGTWLGALDLTHFYEPMTTIHEGDCVVHKEFPKHLQKPMEDLVDAFLYLGPLDLELKEQVPADIALDADYRTELQRRDSLPEFPGGAPRPRTTSLQEENQEIVKDAEEPVFVPDKPSEPSTLDPELAKAIQSCQDRAKHDSAPH